MDSAALLQNARAGSRSALGQLLAQLRPVLSRQAAQSLDARWQARADQSDLAQMTITTAAHAFAAFKGTTEAELVAWLQAILQQHIAAMARLHLQTEKRSVIREVDVPLVGGDSQAAWQPTATGPTPSRLASRSETRVRIEAAIADLPFEQREAVRLRFLDEWTTTQIAQFLDTTERAVAGLLRRGIARLRDQLGDLQSPG